MVSKNLHEVILRPEGLPAALAEICVVLHQDNLSIVFMTIRYHNVPFSMPGRAVMADFGRSDFGQRQCFSGMADFGQNRHWPRQPENSKRAHLSAPALQDTTKIPREDTQRDTKTAKRWREREEKARNFGPSTLRAPTLRAPTLRAPHPSGPHFFWVGSPTLRTPTLRTPTLRAPTLFGPPLGLDIQLKP